MQDTTALQAITGISAWRLSQLRMLIGDGQKHRFYDWPEWGQTRADVLAMDNTECVRCRQTYRRFRPAVLVHHVKHLEDRPDLALSIWDGEERQLVSLCRQCHEEVHPERSFRPRHTAPPLTAERWD